MKLTFILTTLSIVIILLLVTSYIVFYMVFYPPKEVTTYGSVPEMLAADFTQQDRAYNLKSHENFFCYIPGMCGGYITSPYSPFLKLKEVTGVWTTKCHGKYNLHSEDPTSGLENRDLLMDPLWKVYWVLSTRCPGDPPGGALVYGPFKIDPTKKVKLTCDNDNQMLVYTNVKDALPYSDDVCALDISSSWDNNPTKDMDKLQQLKYLYLDYNDFKDIPSEVYNLPNLEEIYFNNNDLTTVPDNLTKLKKLKVLDLSGNFLSIEEQTKIKNMLPNVQVIVDPQR